MTRDDSKIVDFPKVQVTPVTPEERARRLNAEVDRLASLPPVEWLFYLSENVAEKHGVTSATMKEMIEAVIKANEEKARADKAEDRQREQCGEREQAKARKEEERRRREQKREQASLTAERARTSTEKSKKRRATKRGPQLSGYLLIAGMELGVVEISRDGQFADGVLFGRPGGFYWFEVTDGCHPHPDRNHVGGPHPSIDAAVKAAVHSSRVPEGQIRFNLQVRPDEHFDLIPMEFAPGTKLVRGGGQTA